MADNIELDLGSGGAVVATDDIGGIHYQINKIGFGALDSLTLATSGAGNVSAGTQRITLAADDPAVVDLAAIEVLLGTIDADTGNIVTAVQLLDNAVYVDDADWTDSTSSHLLVGGLYQSTPQTVTDGDVAPFNITSTGALHVAQQGTVTVSGTVDLGATDNAVLDSIAASVAAIDTDATTIIGHVDGIEALLGTIDADTSGIITAVQLIDDAIYAEDVAAQAADKGIAILAVRRDADTSLVGTDNDYANLQVNANGALKVEVFSGETLPVSGTITADLGATDNAVLDAIAASLALLDNSIATGNELQVDVVAALPAGTNNIGDVDVLSIIPGTGATNLGKAEDAAHSSSDTGVYALAVRDDSPAAHSGTDGDYESFHINAEGGLWATLLPSASGGCTIFRSLDLDETEEEVKATAGCVYSIFAINTTNAALYLKLYNLTAANTTVGTSTPVLTLPVPGNNDTDGAGFVFTVPQGIGFSTAISAAVTTAVADNDTGAPGANACIVQILYK